MAAPERIVVTGASGFVGQHMVRRLRREWPDAALILVSRRAGQVLGHEVTSLDVADEAAVTALIRETKPDVVVHLAAVSAISNAMADRRMTWQINAMAPYYLASAIMDHSPQSYFLFVSSAEVYGRSAKPGVLLDESTLLQPANPYASAKAAADLFVQEAALAGLRANVVRPFNHIGPGQSLAFAIPSFCSQIVASERGGDRVIRVGSLEDVRDFLHVEDVVDAYVQVIRARDRLPSGAFFNVASGQGVRMSDVLDLLTNLSQVDVRVELDATRLRQRPPTSVVGDAGKLRADIGWAPEHSLRETLAETLDFWRRQ